MTNIFWLVTDVIFVFFQDSFIHCHMYDIGIDELYVYTYLTKFIEKHIAQKLANSKKFIQLK